MKRKKQAGSSLFLMELILVLFFFLLTSAVCIRVFAKAYSISRSSLELSHAQSLCASAAEVFSGTDGMDNILLQARRPFLRSFQTEGSPDRAFNVSLTKIF